MEVYLNPSTNDFTNLLSEDIFVDKTEMLTELAGRINDPSRKYVVVSRPRRFGKTVDANMIIAFFEKNCDRKQFENLRISRFEDIVEKHCGKYHVIKIDVSKKIEKYMTMEEYAGVLEKRVIRDILKTFPIDDLPEDTALVDILGEIYDEKKEQFIFVVDEWDAPLRLKKFDDRQQ